MDYDAAGFKKWTDPMTVGGFKKWTMTPPVLKNGLTR